jgi:hypothetical protein
MLLAQPARRHALAALLGILTLAFAGPKARSGSTLPTLESQARPVAPLAHSTRVVPEVAADSCALGTPVRCYHQPLGSTFLNVGSFFDVNQATSSSHFFLKLYRNDTGGAVALRGMGFESESTVHGNLSPGTNKFSAAGAVFVGTKFVFPKPEALINLTEVGVTGTTAGETCVEFSLAIDPRGQPLPDNVLQPGEQAWLVLRFASYPDSVFVGLRVDDDPEDQPCDYLTPDGGEYWYRPDPYYGPVYDWGMTAYVEPRPARTTAAVSWSLVKTLYR